ncbi:hypothetical protein PENANT_c028G00883 [Penicillium antarcticum]|uniref:Uncharacterized protein n=1 Tax=Penicillium antarcticum TaxID=416450 RepID=A0A1V6PY18_9EURO|nr:uncharacterized protein N7508_009008 [Penicillium antarcticum]KAJ5294187.1 hypothetical protein N7508_009008 [Penicillium antarcticum]OQD81366.1 hypothetical protein PENANT_c028G00883 [Penicillium antarcticum]
MPPKKGQRKSMPARINKTPTLTPSRRSPRVPPQKSPTETANPPKTLNLTPASPQESSINIRFYNPKPAATSPRSQDEVPETPSSRRRAFQTRPSRLSTVYTPTIETPVSQGSRRTRRTAALETPRNDQSDFDPLEGIDNTGWTNDQYFDALGSEGTPDGPSSPTSASDMRNSSRVRKPTIRALESLESAKKKPRKNAKASTPIGEKPAPPSKPVKNNVLKKSAKKTRTSKRMANSKTQNSMILLGSDMDFKLAGKRLFELTLEALNPDFILPINVDAEQFIKERRDEYYQNSHDEKYGTTTSADDISSSQAVDEVVPEAIVPETSAVSASTTPAPAATSTDTPGIIGFEKQSDTKISSDGWIETGYVNDKAEEVSLIPDDYHLYRSLHTYGDDNLPYPPVRARTDQQGDSDYARGYPPLIGSRNLPVGSQSPFQSENVDEEKAKVLSRPQETPVIAPATATRKPRATRKRRQTAAADAIKQDATPDGERKSKRRRRQTEPGPVSFAATGPPNDPAPAPGAHSPPKSAAKAQSHSSKVASIAIPTTEDVKPKVQRIRLTLKPAPEAEVNGDDSSHTEDTPAVHSPSSGPSRAPSPAQTPKRCRRGPAKAKSGLY